PRTTVLARRAFLGQSAAGVGAMALASLLQARERVEMDRWPGVARPFHRPPKVKRVIHLYMSGGPSHLETLDYKPALAKMHGQSMPESFTKGQPIAQLQGQKLNCFAPQHPFKKFGQSGLDISEIFPHIGATADELCVI